MSSVEFWRIVDIDVEKLYLNVVALIAICIEYRPL